MNIFTDEELEKIALMMGYGMTTFTEAQFQKVIAWATEVRLNHGLIENVINGDMTIAGVDRDGLPEFALTPKGEQHVENLIRQGGGVVLEPHRPAQT